MVIQTQNYYGSGFGSNAYQPGGNAPMTSNVGGYYTTSTGERIDVNSPDARARAEADISSYMSRRPNISYSSAVSDIQRKTNDLQVVRVFPQQVQQKTNDLQVVRVFPQQVQQFTSYSPGQQIFSPEQQRDMNLQRPQNIQITSQDNYTYSEPKTVEQKEQAYIRLKQKELGLEIQNKYLTEETTPEKLQYKADVYTYLRQQQELQKEPEVINVQKEYESKMQQQRLASLSRLQLMASSGDYTQEEVDKYVDLQNKKLNAVSEVLGYRGGVQLQKIAVREDVQGRIQSKITPEIEEINKKDFSMYLNAQQDYYDLRMGGITTEAYNKYGRKEDITKTTAMTLASAGLLVTPLAPLGLLGVTWYGGQALGMTAPILQEKLSNRLNLEGLRVMSRTQATKTANLVMRISNPVTNLPYVSKVRQKVATGLVNFAGDITLPPDRTAQKIFTDAQAQYIYSRGTQKQYSEFFTKYPALNVWGVKTVTGGVLDIFPNILPKETRLKSIESDFALLGVTDKNLVRQQASRQLAFSNALKVTNVITAESLANTVGKNILIKTFPLLKPSILKDATKIELSFAQKLKVASLTGASIVPAGFVEYGYAVQSAQALNYQRYLTQKEIAPGMLLWSGVAGVTSGVIAYSKVPTPSLKAKAVGRTADISARIFDFPETFGDSVTEFLDTLNPVKSAQPGIFPKGTRLYYGTSSPTETVINMGKVNYKVYDTSYSDIFYEPDIPTGESKTKQSSPTDLQRRNTNLILRNKINTRDLVFSSTKTRMTRPPTISKINVPSRVENKVSVTTDIMSMININTKIQPLIDINVPDFNVVLPPTIPPMIETPINTDIFPPSNTPTNTFVPIDVPVMTSGGIPLIPKIPSGFGRGWGIFGKKQKGRYSASFTALKLGITSKNRKLLSQGIFTGQEIRPMIVSAGKTIKRKKSKMENNINKALNKMFKTKKKKSKRRR